MINKNMECKQCKSQSEEPICFICELKAKHILAADRAFTKILANFLQNEYVSFLKKKKVSLKESKMSAETIGKAVWLLSLGKITHHQLKSSLDDLYEGTDPVEYFKVSKDFSTVL